MPSKNRKLSKTPLKLSYSDQIPPSQGSASPRHPFESEINEEDIARSLLEEASVRYPSLISKDAFIGRITDVDSNYGSHAAKIWLSESAMVAFSLVPGSIVSVSLAPSKTKPFGDFPLLSLIDTYDCHQSDVLDNGTNDAGSYFALALVFPSCKVSKNGVRLSWSLSCTMGNSSIGKITFVFPIRTHSVAGFLSGSNMLQCSSINSDSCLSLCNCKSLYLALVPTNIRVLVDGGSTTEAHHDQRENGKCASPKTPLLNNSKLNSPSVSNMTRSRDLVSDMENSNQTIFNATDIEEALGNEKSRELLQTCVTLWSRTRLLLRGNLLVIPMGGQTSTFLVQGADEFSIECPSEESVNDEKCVLSHSAQTFDLDHSNIAFFVDYKTKVHINSPVALATQTPNRRGLPSVDPDCGDIKDKEADHVLKLGGLSKEYTMLEDIIMESSVKGLLSSLDLRPTKGALLYGPPGTGKTSLARSCVIGNGRNLFSVNGPEIIGQFHGESEQALREIFESASKASPAVVFIDELDAIAPARKDGGDELSQRLVATLLNLMDGINSTDGILVIAATNRIDSIDPALRRPGRLEREIEIGVPSPKQRLEILLSLLDEIDHALVGTQIQDLASNTHGFVGADLASLCNEAALFCLRRHVKLKSSHFASSVANCNFLLEEPCIKLEGCSNDLMRTSTLSTVKRHNDTESVSSSLSDHTMSSETAKSCYSDNENQQKEVTHQNADHTISDVVDFELEEKGALKVTFGDFEKAKRKVRPSAMREVILEIPKVRWEDVGGQKEAKKQLMEAVEWPQKHIKAFERIGTRPPTGVLLLGPPGCSKTLMARAVASEAGLNFLSVKGPELFSKWVGESEKAVRSLFAKARNNAPSIIFFDEIDGLAVIRGKENGQASVSDRVMSQLLVELDGLHQRVDVTVIAATNRPDKIDPALLRPGRFDRLLYVGPPSEVDREDIFNIHVRRMACSCNLNTKELAHLTDGCTGADISLICREAGNAAIEESRDAVEVSMEHFKIGVGRVQPSLGHPSVVGYYEDFYTKFQRLVSSSAAVDDTPSSAASSSFGFRRLVKSVLLMLFRPFASKAAS